METSKIISKIKAAFHSTHSKKDRRCKIQQSDFLAALVCGVTTQDGRTKSISGLRKSVAELTKELLSRGAFWERLDSKRLSKHLLNLLKTLIDELCVTLDVGVGILRALGVRAVYMLDSSSFSLPDGASEEFPAPRNNVVPAAMKIHMLYDLFSGKGSWFEFTPATTHDRKGFPPLEILKGALIIFDLGYWDFQLFKDMIDLGVLFLSRVKCSARIKVVAVVSGVSKTCVGFNLHSGRLDAFRGEIVEVIGEFIIPKTKETFQCRIIGFWHPGEHAYHWYATNLLVAAIVVYPLYRLRWQLELVWKSWKSILHLDEIKSCARGIIHNLALVGMCAGLIANAIAIATVNESPKELQTGFSVQRSVSFLIRIARDIYRHISLKVRNGKRDLLIAINRFRGELIDPNYKRRPTSMGQVYAALIP